MNGKFRDKEKVIIERKGLLRSQSTEEKEEVVFVWKQNNFVVLIPIFSF